MSLCANRNLHLRSKAPCHDAELFHRLKLKSSQYLSDLTLSQETEGLEPLSETLQTADRDVTTASIASHIVQNSEEIALLKTRKIVFFFPSFASSDATAPLGILAVATPLIRAGYQVVLIDSTITPNYKQRVLEEVSDAMCLGISLVTGPMIRETVEIAKAIKARDPNFPIVLGGWHPSLLPKQTLQAPYIDYVVCGQGEESFLELVSHIENRSSPDLFRHRLQTR